MFKIPKPAYCEFYIRFLLIAHYMLGFFMVKLMVVWLVVNQLNCCIYREWNSTMDIVFLFCALGVWWNVLKNISLIFFVCLLLCRYGRRHWLTWLRFNRLTHHSFVERILRWILPLNEVDVDICLITTMGRAPHR